MCKRLPRAYHCLVLSLNAEKEALSEWYGKPRKLFCFSILFSWREAEFFIRRLFQYFSVLLFGHFSGCYPCPGPNMNPIALGSRWLAYAENKVRNQSHFLNPCQVGRPSQTFCGPVLEVESWQSCWGSKIAFWVAFILMIIPSVYLELYRVIRDRKWERDIASSLLVGFLRASVWALWETGC